MNPFPFAAFLKQNSVLSRSASHSIAAACSVKPVPHPALPFDWKSVCYDTPSGHRMESRNSPVFKAEEPKGIPEFQKVTPPLMPSEFYAKYVKTTDDVCISQASIAQRSDEWHAARRCCITASQFGAAVGLSDYAFPFDVIREKLWGGFQGNVATVWGTSHEPFAAEAFKSIMSTLKPGVTFAEPGLHRYKEQPWMAFSPDGIMHYEGGADLIEYKCPYYARNGEKGVHPYKKHPSNVPPQYMAQIQGSMGLMNKFDAVKPQACWFVSWQPHQVFITRVPFDPLYYETLEIKLETFYFDMLLPAFTAQHNGFLTKGECTKPVKKIFLSK